MTRFVLFLLLALASAFALGSCVSSRPPLYLTKKVLADPPTGPFYIGGTIRNLATHPHATPPYVTFRLCDENKYMDDHVCIPVRANDSNTPVDLHEGLLVIVLGRYDVGTHGVVGAAVTAIAHP